MLTLPLDRYRVRLPIEQTRPQQHHPGCARCRLHQGSQSVCLPPEGVRGDDSGTLLVVGLGPSGAEDRASRLMVGLSGRYLRDEVAKRWKGNVVYTNAVSCWGGEGRDVTEREVTACRPYLVETIRDAKPVRILALGSEAILALCGRQPPIGSVATGYQMLPAGVLPGPVPIVFLHHPGSIRGNPHYRRRFEEELTEALARPLSSFLHFPSGRAYVVRTEQDARQARELLEAEGELRDLSCDIETIGEPHGDDFEIIALSFALSGRDDGWVWNLTACETPAIRAHAIAILQNPYLRKVLQNGKSDATGLLHAWNCRIANYGIDTRLQRKIHDPDSRAKLELLAELVGMGGYKQAFGDDLAGAIKVLEKESKHTRQTRLMIDADARRVDNAAQKVAAGAEKKRYAYGFVPEDKLVVYCVLDSICTSRVGVVTDARLDTVRVEWNTLEIRPLRRVWDLLVQPANEAAIMMEHWGVGADRGAMEALADRFQRRLVDLAKDFEPFRVDPGSSEQVSNLLFKTLKLPVLEISDKTGQPSTDAAVLERLVGKHSIVETLLEYRKYEKLRGTYAIGFQQHIKPDNRIHCTIQIDGARTGRVSVVDPNMNTIPTRSKEGRLVKDCFIAQDADTVLVELDQEQLELRVAAGLSADPVMGSLYQSHGIDFHLETAKTVGQLVFGMDPAHIGKTTMDPRDRFCLRDVSKVANFLVIYAGGPSTLATKIRSDVKTAKQILDAIKAKFEVFFQWSRRVIAAARQSGYTYTNWLGIPARRRPVFAIGNEPNRNERDDGLRIGAEHAAQNTPVQGEAADLQLGALKGLVDHVIKTNMRAKVMLTIYDSIFAEVHRNDVDKFVHHARGIMTSYHNYGVPLAVDVKVGKRWGSMEKYK